MPERGRELVHLAEPVRDDGRRRDDERAELLLLVVLLDVALHREKQRERLHGLAEAHVVGEDAARADLVQEPEPLKARLLIRAELRLQVARLLDALDLVDVAELLEELLGPVAHLRAVHLLEQLLDATRLRERELAAVSAAGREDLRLALEDLADLLRVEARERAVLKAHVAAPLGEAARELLLRDRDAVGLEAHAEREPIDAARDADVRGERRVAHLHVDEIVGRVEVPVVGERRDAVGPEFQRAVAADDEALAVFVGLEPERAELGRRGLLRGDVAANAARALGAGRRRLHDDRRGHAVGAHVDLDVLVGGAERDLRLDERAARAETKRGLEIDHVGDLRELGELGPDLKRDARQALRDELREVFDRLVDDVLADQPAEARGRDALVDRAREALVVDVPAGAALEPRALRGEKLPRVVGAREEILHEHRGPVLRELELEMRLEGLVVVTELHHLRLEDDPATSEREQQIARVLAADLDAHAARLLALEAREDSERLAVGRRRLRLRDEQRARQERRPRLGIDDAHREAVRARLDAVLDLRLRRHRVGEPGLDAVLAVRALSREDALSLHLSLLERAGARAAAATSASASALGQRHGVRADPVGPRGHRRERGVRLRRLLELRRAELIAHGDEQSRHVLAVPVDLRKGRARALRRDAGRRELDRDLVGVGLGAADLTLRRRLLDLDVLDRVTAHVVVAAQESAGSEQSAQRSVVERRDRFREGSGQWTLSSW